MCIRTIWKQVSNKMTEIRSILRTLYQISTHAISKHPLKIQLNDHILIRNGRKVNKKK